MHECAKVTRQGGPSGLVLQQEDVPVAVVGLREAAQDLHFDRLGGPFEPFDYGDVEMPCQRLRAAAAMILEWFRICLRQGWIASAVKRNDTTPEPRRVPDLAMRQIVSERRRLALP